MVSQPVRFMPVALQPDSASTRSAKRRFQDPPIRVRGVARRTPKALDGIDHRRPGQDLAKLGGRLEQERAVVCPSSGLRARRGEPPEQLVEGKGWELSLRLGSFWRPESSSQLADLESLCPGENSRASASVPLDLALFRMEDELIAFATKSSQEWRQLGDLPACLL